ncbi:MAG: fibronectin/fibrinogen-binding protein [Syntrophomonadaceae bacterium]|nr:fibronectin/fibrinogen-binding protein [Syntrophomonadaceae bacterium]
MPFDGFTIRAIANELNSTLFQARIDKIHQPEKDEIILSVRQAGGGTVKLLLSANPRWSRMHISNERKLNPVTPPGFCMLLRKYLEGGKITSVKQYGFDRIVYITIEALDELRDWKPRLLIGEFTGRHSNIILVNPETGLIIDAIKRFNLDSGSIREIMPGKEYISPPAQNKIDLLQEEYEQFAARMWQQNGQSASQALFNSLAGVSPFSARCICQNAFIEPNIPVEECGDYELHALYQQVKTLLQDISITGSTSCILYRRNKMEEYLAFELYNPSAEYNLATFDSINETCDQYYSAKMEKIRLDSMKTNLLKNINTQVEKSRKKKFYQEGDLAKAQENEKYKTWGELITSYAHQINKGDRQAVLEDFYTNESVVIELDPRWTPIENAQRYFKIYNKSRNAIKHLEYLLKQSTNEIIYLESVIVTIEQADSIAEQDEIIEELEKEGYLKARPLKGKSRKLPKSLPRKYISTDGLEILVGRNNRQNDSLTIKGADRHDLWLHTKDIPGTHVIIRLPNYFNSVNQLPDATLEEAAMLAAYYSKASEDEKVQVDYTFRNNVRKPSGAKPGMVVYDNYWTIIVNPRSERMLQIIEKVE